MNIYGKNFRIAINWIVHAFPDVPHLVPRSEPANSNDTPALTLGKILLGKSSDAFDAVQWIVFLPAEKWSEHR